MASRHRGEAEVSFALYEISSVANRVIFLLTAVTMTTLDNFEVLALEALITVIRANSLHK